MNKFNVTMTALIIAAIVFFGFGIIQKVTYKAVEGDVVSLSYTVVSGEDTYDTKSASVKIGDNTNTIFTDDIVLGVKANDQLAFDTTLTEDLTIDNETTITSGTDVSIEATVSAITPGTDEEADSEATSETNSEVTSETDSE